MVVPTTGSNFAREGCRGRRWEPINGDAGATAAAIREFEALGVSHYVRGLPTIAALDRG